MWEVHWEQEQPQNGIADATFTTSVGNGNNLNVAAPATSTTYYVRFEGTCGNTTAQSVAVNVDIASIAPTAANVDVATYCDDAAPATITLSYTGGTMGTGATAEWYSDATFTTGVATGNNQTIAAPAITTTYYVRFEGTCNTTSDESVTVTVDNASVAPTSAGVDFATYCDIAAPANIQLSYVGGSLGTGATAEWYSDATFTTSVGNGNNLSIAAPATSTTYYVRFEGTCGNTTAQSIAVNVDIASIAPTAANVDVATYCDDAAPATITLSYTGGTMGTGATAEWYSDATFTTGVATGNNQTIAAPAITTTYYVRFEGTCNTTSDESVTVTVDNASVAPATATVSDPTYCDNNLPAAGITLAYTGGSLGTGATAEWYDDISFTNNIGTGNNILISPAPSVSTTYFVRFEGNCGVTSSQSVSVNVDAVSTEPTAASVDVATYCDDAAPANITLSFTGGTLGTGSTAEWYSDIGFATNVGSGNDLVLTAPTVTTTYFVRFEGSCGNTGSQSVSVTVDNASIAPTSAAVDITTYCEDAVPANIVLSYVGGTLGTGATAEWYNDAGFTTSVGTGNNLSIVAPAASMTFFVRFEGDCNITSDQSVSVDVVSLPDATITGPTNVCANTTESYSAPTGAASYAWSIVGGDGVITGGAGHRNYNCRLGNN
jgi:hypothetical protein